MRIVLLALVVKVFLSQLSHVKSFNVDKQDLIINKWSIMMNSKPYMYKCQDRIKEVTFTGKENNIKLIEDPTDEAKVSITIDKTTIMEYQMSAYYRNESLRNQQSSFLEANLIEQSMFDFYKAFLNGPLRFIFHFPRTHSMIIKLLILILIRILLKGSSQTEFQFLSLAFLNLDLLSFASISPSPSFSTTSWQTSSISSHVRSQLNATHVRRVILTSSVLRNGRASSSVEIEGSRQSSESKKTLYTRGECDLGWIQFNNYCYLPSNEQRIFDHAQRACSFHGANLISITNKSENELIFNISKDYFKFPSKNFLWLGMERRVGSKRKSQLHWIDGSDLNYNNWIPGEPDGNGACVQMIMRGLWEDTTCFEKNSFICKKRSSYPPPYTRTTELGILVGIPLSFAFIMMSIVTILIFKSIRDADDTFYGYGKNRNKEKMHAAIVTVTASVAHVSAQASSPKRRQSEASPRRETPATSTSQSLSSSRVNPAVEVSDTGSQSPISSHANPKVKISDSSLQSPVPRFNLAVEVSDGSQLPVENRKNSTSGRDKLLELQVKTADPEEIEMHVCGSAVSLDNAEPPRFQSTTSLDHLVSKSYIKPKSRKLRGLKNPEATIRPSGKEGIYRKKTSV